jgi:hypothetical protein
MPTVENMNISGWSSAESNLWGTAQIIAVVGVVFALLSVFGLGMDSGESEKKHGGIKMNAHTKHYRVLRDELTLRTTKDDGDDEDDG